MEKKLSMLQKIGYGLGDFGSNYCWTFVGSFLLIYCSDTLGISTAIIGTLLMISRVFDGISDVFMGRIIDRTHHRMGKARFWYFVSCFPVAILTFLIFAVPNTMADGAQYAYVFVIYTLLGAVAYTMNNIAYSTLTALVTTNANDRVQMGTLRFICAIVATLLINTFTSALVESLGGGSAGWMIVAAIYAVICLVFLLIPVFSVHELPESELGEDREGAQQKEPGFFQGLGLLLKNRYFLIVLGLYFFTYLGTGITSGMGIYYATYQLGDASLLGLVSMAGLLPTALGLPFVPALTKKFGLRNAALGGIILSTVFGLVLILGGLIGSFPLVIAGLLGKALAGAPAVGGLTAMVAEVDDYSSLKFGQRLTGTIFSCSSVGVKVGTGLGTAAVGFFLELGGYNGLAAVQTARAVSVINWSFLLANFLPMLIDLLLLWAFRVEKDNCAMRAEIGGER